MHCIDEGIHKAKAIKQKNLAWQAGKGCLAHLLCSQQLNLTDGVNACSPSLIVKGELTRKRNHTLEVGDVDELWQLVAAGVLTTFRVGATKWAD
jgi:hypothetical protein